MSFTKATKSDLESRDIAAFKSAIRTEGQSKMDKKLANLTLEKFAEIESNYKSSQAVESYRQNKKLQNLQDLCS